MLILFVLMIGLPLSAEAQTNCSRYRRAKRSYASRSYRAAAPRYRTAGYVYQRDNRSFYQRHRDKINVALGTGGGALLGGLFGGKKGAVIGGLLGAGGSALYTYKIRPKRKRY